MLLIWFKVYIQNAIYIIDYLEKEDKSEFIKAIDGIAVEAYLFAYKKQNATHYIKNNPIHKLIKEYQKQDIDVLSVEYLKDKNHINQYFTKAQELAVRPLVTDYGLKGKIFIHD